MTARSTGARTIRGSCAGAVLTLACGAGFEGCQCHDVCPQPYNPLEFCVMQGTCTVDGTAITNCADDGTTPSCVLWNPPARQALALPVGAMWPILGTRDDLAIGCSCSSTSPGDGGGPGSVCDGMITVLFDGVPATGCTCPPGQAIMCSDIPHSVQVISLTFAEGASDLGLEFHDNQCEAAHRICER